VFFVFFDPLIFSDPMNVIYESAKTVVYQENNEVFKLLKDPFPDAAKLSAFRNEYSLLQGLNLEGVRKIKSETKLEGFHALVCEYFNGISIKDYLLKHGIFPLDLFYQVAIRITETLAQVHQRSIIHRDINTNNILINPETKAISIIDFGLATQIDVHTKHLGNPEHLEGTLPYISPEQTGRMNRMVDYRTDLYSLGVTFYEMLTGTVPFKYASPLEIVHAHLAKTPTPVKELREEIPSALSAIIQTLLEKNAEDRYRSTMGLKYDIEAAKTKPDTFVLKESDFSEKLNLSQKLYGRDKEREKLLTLFEQISKGEFANLHVAGYSGVGKTALISEIYKPITEKSAYFVVGKFDQNNQNFPYLAWKQAITEWCDLEGYTFFMYASQKFL
jgi:histidine kinase